MATKKSKGLSSPLMTKYRALQRAKKRFCAGKTTKTLVKKAEKAYITAAVAKGQTVAEATSKAGKVLRAGCSMSSSIAGRRKKAKTTTRKKTVRLTGTKPRKVRRRRAA